MKKNAEIFNQIKEFEGFYEISNHGNVRSVDRVITVINNGNLTKRKDKGKFIKSVKKNNGYLQVGLTKSGVRKYFSIHRLVALTFIPNPTNLPQVNHIDGNKTNNSIENLEWVTSKENHLHASKLGIGHYKDGRNGFSKAVINTLTGEEFETARLAYVSYEPNYGYIYFTRKLSGEKINDTPFIYK